MNPEDDWFTQLDGTRINLTDNVRQQIMQLTAQIAARQALARRTDPPDLPPGEIVPVGSGSSSKSSLFISAMESISDRVELIKAETAAMRDLGPLISEIEIPRRDAA